MSPATGGILAQRLQTRAGAALRLVLGLPPEARLNLDPPPSGRAGRTLLVREGERPLAVLRAFRSRRRLRRLQEATSLLSALSVPVARIIWSDTSFASRLRRGAYLSLEAHLPGTTLGRLQERGPALDRLAAVLGRLHAHRRPRWGTFHSGKARGFAAYRCRQIGRLLQVLRYSGAISRTQERQLRQRCSGWRERWERVREFNLIHNDLHFENILVGPDGDVSLIDLYRLRFDRRERELAGVLGRLLDLEPGACGRFLQVYERGGGAAPEADLLEQETAVLCLSRWSSLTARGARMPGGVESESLQREARRWSERFLASLGNRVGSDAS